MVEPRADAYQALAAWTLLAHAGRESAIHAGRGSAHWNHPERRDVGRFDRAHAELLAAPVLKWAHHRLCRVRGVPPKWLCAGWRLVGDHIEVADWRLCHGALRLFRRISLCSNRVFIGVRARRRPHLSDQDAAGPVRLIELIQQLFDSRARLAIGPELGQQARQQPLLSPRVDVRDQGDAVKRVAQEVVLDPFA
eukprot:scaffold165353_cov29-Tisochrysis_lutea.AAC.3